MLILGLQPFCAAAVDSYGQVSTQYCVMIVVGGTNPGIYTPQYVQGTATPLGTVMSTQMRFSIQSNNLFIRLFYKYQTRIINFIF